jgi:proteasome assembly chaperone (PAC2) family protein
MRANPERWLVAAWPGMGQVATTAAIYLLSKLRMHQMAEFPGRGLFELESVDVHDGLVRASRLPRSRLFLWRNPTGGRDIIVFLGEAQPPTGKLALCEWLLAEGRALGVSRFFTFSAITTDMKPSSASRSFGVASDTASLQELKSLEVAILAEGSIAGLNGVALAAAAEAGIPSTGILGEMPALASQLPYPNASAAVLRTFKDLANLELDLTELEEYGRSMQDQLSSFYDQILRSLQEAQPVLEAPPLPPADPPAPLAGGIEPSREKMLGDEDAERVEGFFLRARLDRSTAFELKKELERLGVFHRYEDRFLDLFEHGST